MQTQDQHKNQSLKLSYLDAFLYNLMVGAGETYLPAYALSIGLGEVFAGILSTLPLMSGAFLQLFTPKYLQMIRSAKHWVVISTLTQALSFLPLVYYSNYQTPGFWTLFLILTLYWGAGFSTSPAWNYWMGHLIPEEKAKNFFTIRNRVSQAGLLIGLVGGGVALHNKVDFLPFSSIFASLFFFAFIFRALSSFILSHTLFEKKWFMESNPWGLIKTWRIFAQNKEKKIFFLKIVPFILCVNISAPFVAPYLLAELKLDYGAFMLAIAFLLIGKILTSYALEKFSPKVAARKIFAWGALLAAPLPVLWPVSESIYFILILQMMSGMAWAFYEVGLGLIFFKDLSADEKISSITVYNFLNSLAVILGTIVGAQFLNVLGTDKINYYYLFVLAGCLRFAVAVRLF